MGIATLLIFMLILLIGVPIAFAMGVVGGLWIVLFDGLNPVLLARRMFGIMNSFPLLAIPLFTMLGILAERSELLPNLVTWLQMVLGRFKGSIAYMNVANSMVMGGVSGAAVSDVASLGRVEIRMMRRAGYPAPYSAALTASTAVISPIMPPSVAMIIFALAVGNVSIGGLFMAGVLPAVVMGLGLWTMAWYKSRQPGFGTVVERPPMAIILRQTLRVVPFFLLPPLIVGGIVSGLFTVTESAAMGVLYVIAVSALMGKLRWRDLYDAIVYSALISSVVGMLMGTGAIVSWIITRNQLALQMAEMIASLTQDPQVFMALAALMLLALGTVMDVTALMIALAPMMVPIARSYGIADLQFGMVFILSCMVGMVTPPTGILLFMVASFAEIPIEKVFRAILPFVLAAIVLVGLLILFPHLTLWLPQLLGYRT